ncbi:MAG: serine/threonine protein kinase [Burkholderiales bacterium]|nr:serine/threonine protein kinase [Burkholderiales bacterium]
MTSNEAEPAPGTLLAGYRIERLLGHGGMGAVYLARNAVGTEVALKVLDLGGSDEGQLRHAFEREVASSRRLDHPGIVRLFDTGQVGRLAFMAMEYIAGGELGRYRHGHRPVPVRLAVDIVARIARALAHAHAAGIVHRDIKPANILVDERAHQVKLADFGLARLSDLQRSRTGILAGTPAYMSPEQLAEGAQDARSDLYSVGVVLFELLTGRLPHEAPSLGALLRQVSQLAPPPVHRLRPQTPPALSALVAQLLEKDKERRPPDAQTLARELEGVLSDLPAEPQPGAAPGAP